MTESISIPFNKLLKIVAVVDDNNVQVQTLLKAIAADGYEVEITASYERDVFEDAAVGAYIIAIDGDNGERARILGKAIRGTGNKTPSWALADSYKLADLSHFESLSDVSGFIYLGQQTPAFYAKQVIASLIEYGMSLLPPFFGGLMAYDFEANIAFDCPGHQGGQFYRKSPAGQFQLSKSHAV